MFRFKETTKVREVKPHSVEAQKLKALEIAVKDTRATHEALVEQAELMSKEVKALETQIVALDNKKSILEQTVAEYEVRKTEIEEKIDTSFNNEKSLDKDISDKTTEVARLNEELQSLDIPKIVKNIEDKTRQETLSKLESVLEEIEQKTSAVQELKNDISLLQERKEVLHSNIQDLLKDLEHAKLHLTTKELRDINKNLQHQATNTEQNLLKMQGVLQESRTSLEEINKDIELAKERSKLAKSQYKEKQEELKDVQKSIESLNDKKAEVSSSIKEADKLLAQKLKDIDELSEEIVHINKMSKHLDKQEKVIRSKYKILGIEYVEFNQNI
jgi:chromosome segregation ATPase